MDEFTSHNGYFEQDLNNLGKVLTRCREVNLCLNSEKCQMMLTKGVVLGNLISPEGIKVDPIKIEVILNLLVPHTQKEVRSFIGYASYYTRFVQKISKIAIPLFLFMSKNKQFEWSDACQLAWETLKHKVSTTSVL